MNGDSALVTTMVAQLKPLVSSAESEAKVVLCPPFPYLGVLKEVVSGTAIGIGAQNVHTQPSGAFTGEVSVSMLQEWNTTHCIIGHSERRQYFGETDELVHQKATLLLEKSIQPVICVGESLEQRESGQHETTVLGQLSKALEGMDPNQLSKCIIAYEPVWAIGTGKTATAEQANQMHSTIRQKLTTLSNESLSRSIPILYGGSVNAKNSGELLQQPEIDGSLVGGASLKLEDFSQIIQSCS